MLSETQFGARAISLGKKEFCATVKGHLSDALYKEYCNGGNDEPVEQWLRPRFKQLFQFLVAPPQWIQDNPNWPYENGKPMVFVNQHAVATDVLTPILGVDFVVYTFGARVDIPEFPGRWRVEFRTVVQDGDVARMEKKITAKRAKEDADEEARLALREQKMRAWEAPSANEPPKGKKKKW